MNTPSRYTEYEVIDLSLDGVDQLISVLEQLVLLGCERVTTGEEGTRRFVRILVKHQAKIKYSLSILILLTPAVELPAQLIATTEYSYTVLILSCVLSVN